MRDGVRHCVRAIVRSVIGADPVDDVERETPLPHPVVTLSAEAQRMLADGATGKDSRSTKSAADGPLKGSARARFEDARRKL